VRLQHPQRDSDDLVHLLRMDHGDGGDRGARHGPGQPVDALLRPQHLCCLGPPLGPLLSFGAGAVLGSPGLQGGLLGQLDSLDRGRWAGVVGLEPGGQRGAADVDLGPPGRPRGEQLLGHPGGLPDVTLPGGSRCGGVGSRAEGQPESAVQLGLDAGVVPLRGGDRGLEQNPSVQGKPAAGSAAGVEDADLGGDGDVGVQVGVSGPGVAVVERGRDHPGGVQLLHSVAAAAGADDLLLQPGKGVLHRGVVCGLDLGGDVPRGDRPERRHRLDRGEGEVEPGHRGGRRPGVAGDEGGQLTRVPRRPAVLPREHLPADVGADPGPLRGRQRRGLRHPQGQVGLRAGPRDRDLELRGGVDDRERLTEADRCLRVRHRGGPVRAIGATADAQGVKHGRLGPRRVHDPVRVGVFALPEQGRHLVLGDLVPAAQVHVTQRGPEPLSRGLTLLAVVVRQAGVPTVGDVQRGDLPGQVRVPVPGGQLVDGHHIPLSTKPPSGSTPREQLTARLRPVMQKV